MRRHALALLGAIVVLGMLAPTVSNASHIAVAATVGVPDQTSTTHTVNFTHVEKESSQCCGGGPSIEFGDNTIGYLDGVTINQDTEPGTYTASLYDMTTYDLLGTFPYTVSHAGVPPLPNGVALNTEITFSHDYPAAGNYSARWDDCCAGAPQLPLDPAGVQDTLDTVWYDTVTPNLQSVEDIEPVGIDHGTNVLIFAL